MWLRRLGAAALLALVAAMAACGSGGTKGSPTQQPFSDNPTPIAGISTAAPFPLTVQRSDGKTLTIVQPPKRIVSLSPGATEIIYALGAEGSLAAVDKQADYPDGAKNFPTKVDAYEPNIEAIAALSPDLVIVASDTGGLVAKLDDLKIPVLFEDISKDIRTVDDVLGQIRLLGHITATDAKALDLISSLGARVQDVEQKLQGASRQTGPKVYHELDSTFFTASDGTFIGDLYRILHMNNIAGSGAGNPYPQLTQEAIIAADPDVIILADEGFGVTVDSVKARPGWSAISAVKNSRIYAIDPDIISRPGPRIVDALEQLAKAVYPEDFP